MNGLGRLAEIESHPRWPLTDDQMAELSAYFDQAALNSVAGLRDLLSHVIAEGGELTSVVEVGCYEGVSTECIALHCMSGTLTAIDPWHGVFDVKDKFDTRMAGYSNVRILREASPGAAKHFPDGSLDLVYIDGMHTRTEVEADIRAWLSKIRNGGWIAGHDYVDYRDSRATNYIQVIPAVRATIGEPDSVFTDSSWLKRVKR